MRHFVQICNINKKKHGYTFLDSLVLKWTKYEKLCIK